MTEEATYQGSTMRDGTAETTIVWRGHPHERPEGLGLGMSVERIADIREAAARIGTPGSRKPKRPRHLSWSAKYFWPLVFQRGPVWGKMRTRCWSWLGKLSGQGYPYTTKPYLGTTSAQRASYMLHKGTLPKARKVQLLCGYPPCVNPLHIILAP